MALITSTMLNLGTVAPDFSLLDTVSGEVVSLEQLRSEVATVIMFICNHCPYVKHIQQELPQLANDYQPRGVIFAAISANDVQNYPEDDPKRMTEVAKQVGYPFPYLYDETQAVARAFKAACTPDFYIFDADLACVYRGRLDGATPGNDVPVTGEDLRCVLDALLAGKAVDPNQKPSMGCNIKWKE